jgi:hypothetical protein
VYPFVAIVLESRGHNRVYYLVHLTSVGTSNRVDLRKLSDVRDFSLGEVWLLLFDIENKIILITHFAKNYWKNQTYGEGHRICIIAQSNIILYYVITIKS